MELILGCKRPMELTRGPWHEAPFWDDVRDEVNVENMRWSDFASFVSPTGPLEPPESAFSDALRDHLRELVRRLYAT